MNKELILLNMLIMTLYLITLFFLLSNMKILHPIYTMINLLLYSILTCLNLSIWKTNYLYSILLFLIMISGLLIIFLYFSSLISNEQMKFKFNWIFFLSMLSNFLIIMYLMFTNNYNNFPTLMMKYNFHEISPLPKINLMNFNNITFMYEYPFNNLMILSMFYLLISLFSIIKICSFKSLSMRKIT